MCIWCLRNGLFTEKEWKEIMHEELNRPSLLDQVKQYVLPKQVTKTEVEVIDKKGVTSD